MNAKEQILVEEFGNTAYGHRKMDILICVKPRIQKIEIQNGPELMFSSFLNLRPVSRACREALAPSFRLARVRKTVHPALLLR